MVLHWKYTAPAEDTLTQKCHSMEYLDISIVHKCVLKILILILCGQILSVKSEDLFFKVKFTSNNTAVVDKTNKPSAVGSHNLNINANYSAINGIRPIKDELATTSVYNDLKAKRDVDQKGKLLTETPSSKSALQHKTNMFLLPVNQTHRTEDDILVDQVKTKPQKDDPQIELVPKQTPDGSQNRSFEGQIPMSTIYIGGLFDLDKSNGRSEYYSAIMATEHVNEKNILPGYRLQMVANNTKCDPGFGADAFYDMMYGKSQVRMLIGTSCSEVAQMLGEIVPYWNLVMISHAATSSALSDREKYPSFFRLATADSSHNPARRSFLQHLGWKIVATIIQDKQSLSLANNDMIKDLEAANISVKAALSFRDFAEDLPAKMMDLKKTDARIIIGSFSEEAACQVFCEAFKLGLYGPRYVWMLLGSYVEKWWLFDAHNVSCSPVQLEAAVDGHFTVEDLTSIIGNGKSTFGRTTQEFLELYKAGNLPSPRSKHAQTAYDSVWTVVLTLEKILSFQNKTETNLTEIFTNENGKEMYEMVLEVMSNLEFTGVSGPISFDGSDRHGISVIEQIQNGESKRVALYFPDNGSLLFDCEGCQGMTWKGGKIPVDSIKEIVKKESVSTVAVLVVCLTSVLGLVMAVSFLCFNIYHRDLKYIKLSSPRLNNVAVIGCVLVYASIILLGIDDHILMSLNFKAICMGRAYLWTTGYSLAFGAMFFKTYRVYQIFRRANSGILRSKLLKDTQLLLLVGVLLVLDSVVMALWIVLDPMDRQIRNISAYQSSSDPDIYYIPQMSSCSCRHLQKWMGSLYAYKGLLLLFGMYMAWETRNVQIAALNDSRYIGMNIYNVLIASVTVVVLSSVLTDSPTLSFILISTLINISTTVLLALLFFPKIYVIYQKKGSPVVTSSGMTLEGNTRRFVTDDKKELFYRAEVENRFLKRKLTQLEEEIARIEILLSMSCEEFANIKDCVPEILKPASPTAGQHRSPTDTSSGCSKRNRISNQKTKDIAHRIPQDIDSEIPLLGSQKTISSANRSSPPAGGVIKNPLVLPSSLSVFPQKRNSSLTEKCQTDPEYDEMMSEMGPPGMFTLIFDNVNQINIESSNNLKDHISETESIDICSKLKELSNVDKRNKLLQPENG